MTNAMQQVGAGPKESGVRCFDQAGDRGRRAGAAWAEDSAEYLDLKRLAASAGQHRFEGEQAGFRIVNTILGERHLSKREFAAFLEAFGLEHDEADLHNREYWQGFLQSALEAFREVEI